MPIAPAFPRRSFARRLKDEPIPDKESPRMKRLVKPATLLAVVAAVFSVNQLRSSPNVAASAEVRAEANDPYDCEAAYRHRTCQPRHWRGLMLRE
jgi:hypothetical protein